MTMTNETIAEAAVTLTTQIRDFLREFPELFYSDSGEEAAKLEPRRLDPTAPRAKLTVTQRMAHVLALLALIPEKLEAGKREQAMRWLCWCQGVTWELGLVENIATLKAANAPPGEPNEDQCSVLVGDMARRGTPT